MKATHLYLKRFHNYCTLFTQVILASILVAVVLWLFLRIPDPTVRLTGFEIEAIANNATNPNSTLIHYNITFHNPDLYKSLDYDVLVMMVTYAGGGLALNMDKDKKGIHHKPGGTITLSNNTVNFSRSPYAWPSGQFVELLKPAESRSYVLVSVILGVKCRVFSRVIATRQSMRLASVYFNDTGSAFLDHPFGLQFK